jgi:hypothetical protein
MTPTQSHVVEWLAKGAVGCSSKAMAMWLAFNQKTDDWDPHPHDPDDLDRCLKLLVWAPLLRLQLPRMAELSPAWKALVARWDEIEASHLEEVGLGWTKARSAPKTYKLMRSILDGVTA